MTPYSCRAPGQFRRVLLAGSPLRGIVSRPGLPHPHSPLNCSAVREASSDCLISESRQPANSELADSLLTFEYASCACCRESSFSWYITPVENMFSPNSSTWGTMCSHHCIPESRTQENPCRQNLPLCQAGSPVFPWSSLSVRADRPDLKRLSTLSCISVTVGKRERDLVLRVPVHSLDQHAFKARSRTLPFIHLIVQFGAQKRGLLLVLSVLASLATFA